MKKYKQIDSKTKAHLLAEGADRQKFLQATHSRLKCRGGPRSYGDVGSALKEMVKDDLRLDWALDLYVTASGVAHQLLPDRIMKDIGEGRSAVVLPDPPERAARMDHLLVTYGLVGQRFFQIVKPGRQPVVVETMSQAD